MGLFKHIRQSLKDKKDKREAEAAASAAREQIIELESKQRKSEQRALSILLLQKLVQVYMQNDLTTNSCLVGGWNPGRSVTAKTKDGKLVYEVFFAHYDKQYSLNIPTDTGGLINFGTYYNDGTYFRDAQYSYTPALFYMTLNNEKVESNPVIQHLMTKKPEINLAKTTAWPSYRIGVFNYLDKFITKQK